jgi:hypothetical protein
MRSIRHLVLSTCLLALAACGPDVPSHPGYEADVLPILASRCLRCHSPQYFATSGTAPYDFSTYASASQYAPRMVDAIKRSSRRMPLGARALADWQIETIENWASEVPPGP